MVMVIAIYKNLNSSCLGEQAAGGKMGRLQNVEYFLNLSCAYTT